MSIDLDLDAAAAPYPQAKKELQALRGRHDINCICDNCMHHNSVLLSHMRENRRYIRELIEENEKLYALVTAMYAATEDRPLDAEQYEYLRLIMKSFS